MSIYQQVESHLPAQSLQAHPAVSTKRKVHKCDHDQCDYSTDKKSNLKTHQQTHLPADQRPQRPKVHKCDHDQCDYSTDRKGDLKTHQQTHLPADQRPKVHKCDHDQCDYSTDKKSHLKTHQQTHLPADQRPKVHKCDHDQCDYSTEYKQNLKTHQQTHLPADQRPQRPKVHKCDHDQCDYSTEYKQNLKTHQQTHLPADQRPKVHKCDHDQCDYSTDRKGDLKTHQQTHLPADQRPKVHKCDHDQCDYSTEYKQNLKTHQQTHLPADQRPKVHKCDHDQCDYSTDKKSNLKTHQQTHLPADQRPQRPKVHKCDHDQCDYSTDRKGDLKTHQQTHLPADQRPKVHKCDHDQCDYSTDKKSHLKTHQQTHLPAEANKIDDVQIIKQEPVYNYWFNVKHRTDNRAPLWAAESSIKQEFTELEPNKKTRTYFSQIGIPKNDGVRSRINQAISYYKCLNHEDRERYLNERLSVQKHDGSIFSELKDQDEVIANRDLAQWEILGHYAGKHYTDDSYSNGANSMGTILTNIDRYSFNTTQGQFISGFRSGNVTTLINACKTYSESENGRNLPEQNVSYMRHTDEQGKWIVFIIALKDIKAGVRLWTDYGKQYWESMGSTIEISDNEDDAE
ncbi:hypothetical protein [Endozoicomonas atrinae]|uniref:hypothetical protein n=1 Tax=Endozoicomonas atrinae TaxID=1333660 RepID=UPI003AFF757A